MVNVISEKKVFNEEAENLIQKCVLKELFFILASLKAEFSCSRQSRLWHESETRGVVMENYENWREKVISEDIIM